MSTGELRFVITTDDKGSIKKVEALHGGLDKTKKKADSARKSYAGMIKKMLAGATAIMAARKLFSFMKDSISLASDAMEEHSKLHTVFRDVSAQTADTVKMLTDSYGLSTLGAERMLASTGDLLTGLGMSQKTALSLSEQTQKLAVDLASFTNIQGGATRASEALTKGMLGEKEMSKALGISILEADIKLRLFEKGQKNLVGTALKAAKAQAFLELAMEQSKNAMGDFARTQDSFANQSRILTATIEDIRVEVGKSLVQTLTPALKDFSNWVKENKDTIIGFFTGLTKILVTAAKALLALTEAAVKFGSGIMDMVDVKALIELDKQETAFENLNEKLYGFALNADFAQGQAEVLRSRMEHAGASFRTADEKLAALKKVMEDIKTGKLGDNLADQFKNVFKETVNAAAGVEKYTKALKINAIPVTDTLEESEKELTDALDMALDSLGEYEKGWEGLLPALYDAKKEGEHLEFQTDNLTDAEGRAAEATHILQAALASLEDLGVIPAGLAKAFDAVKSSIAGVSSGLKLLESGKGLDKILGGLSIAGGAAGIFGAAVDLFGSIFGKKDYGPSIQEQVAEGMEPAAKALNNYVGSLNLTEEALSQLSYMMITYAEAGKTATQATEDFVRRNLEAQNAILTRSETQDALNKMLATWINTKEQFDALAAGAITKKEFDALAAGAKTQEEFAAQANITMSVFAGLVRSGSSIVEAIDVMGESFDNLIKTQKNTGFTASDTFQQLLKFRKLIKENEALVDSAMGLNATFELINKTIGITEDSFADFATLTLSKYNDLITAGFSQAEALQIIAPMLKNLQTEAEKAGFAVDEDLQSLIDMADSANLFDGMQNVLVDIKTVLEDIAAILRGDLPTAMDSFVNNSKKQWETFGNAAANAYGQGFGGFGGVPGGVRYDRYGSDTAPGGAGGGNTYNRSESNNADIKNYNNINISGALTEEQIINAVITGMERNTLGLASKTKKTLGVD